MHLSKAACAAVASLLAAAAAAAQISRAPDVVFVPTPDEVVHAMLQMARVGPGDVVYDLGAGDGRIVIAAVKDFGAARGVGIELDPVRVREANASAKQFQLESRVEFRQQDLFATDLQEASVVALYLHPAINVRLRPRLQSQLRPGSRVVSHAFDMGDWMPDEAVYFNGRNIYLWRIPERP